MGHCSHGFSGGCIECYPDTDIVIGGYSDDHSGSMVSFITRRTTKRSKRKRVVK